MKDPECEEENQARVPNGATNPTPLFPPSGAQETLIVINGSALLSVHDHRYCLVAPASHVHVARGLQAC